MLNQWFISRRRRPCRIGLIITGDSGPHRYLIPTRRPPASGFTGVADDGEGNGGSTQGPFGDEQMTVQRILLTGVFRGETINRAIPGIIIRQESYVS
jgi:hypothetical protein